MSRLQLIILHASAALLTLTGLGWAWFKYFGGADQPGAFLQPWMFSAHIVVAPVMVFGLGWVTSSHIVPKLWNSTGVERRSGLALNWIAAPMVLTGYLLQISSAELLRQIMTWGHWISGAAFALGYAAHVLIRNRA